MPIPGTVQTDLRPDTPPRPVRRWLRIALFALAIVVIPLLATAPFADAIIAELRQLAERGPLTAFLAIVGILAVDAVMGIPHGLVGTFAGAALAWPAAALAIWLGIMAASIASYAIGRWAGQPLARRLLGEKDLAAAQRLAERLGWTMVLFTRPVPVIGELVMVAAGIAAMPFRRFLGAVALANLVLAALYAGLGSLVSADNEAEIVLLSAIGIPAIALAVYLGLLRLSRRSGRRIGNETDASRRDLFP